MDGSCARGFRQRPVWLVAVAALVAGQAGLALHLFGGPAGLTDPRPVVAGRHPLHLYHGALGAETFRQRWATACYDPSFQAGYPKTPVFDAGCRPGEFFLVLAGTAVVGWYAHPVVWLGLAPVVAVYYLALAPRHGPAWHLGLAGVTAAGMAPNMWWLWDWGKFWWLRQPSVDDIAPLPTWGA